MQRQEWLLIFLIAGTATAMVPVLHRTMEESLRGALDAISRKQRSLDSTSQDYYNDLRSFKYHGDDADRKFDRDRQGEREIVVEDEEIEFLPNEVGQLETVGNGFQDLNNKLLERALIDYVESAPQQEEPVTSLFRERERISNRKRGSGVDNKELAKLFLDEQDGSSPYSLGDVDDEMYMDGRQALYDRFRPNHGNNKLYENTGSMSWGEALNKEALSRAQNAEVDENEYSDREQDPNLLYLTLAERRNVVNGRYPVDRDFRTYRNMVKRYSVAKRSPQPLATRERVTDPKVAQDLGALFGTQPSNNRNRTHDHEHNHDHDHDHNHNHDHDHNHEHDHDKQNHESTSESPKVTPPAKGQKENATKLGKSKSIEVRKKSVDWSQYFGIDRRRKKASLMAGQGTQNQDDEWMLQRYYENMGDNLRGNDREYKKENIDRNVKLEDLIMEKALRYADTEEAATLQKVKDKVMARLAAQYSLEKMRKALYDLRNSFTARPQPNQTSNFRENNDPSKQTEKRTNKNIGETEGDDEIAACAKLKKVDQQCRAAAMFDVEALQMFYVPCIALHTCFSCMPNDSRHQCFDDYFVETDKICDTLSLTKNQMVACQKKAVLFI